MPSLTSRTWQPTTSVRGSRPEDVSYTGAATALQDVWIELRASMRGVLEQTSLADLVERSTRAQDAESAGADPASREHP